MKIFEQEKNKEIFKQVFSTKTGRKYSKSLNLSQVLGTEMFIHKEVLNPGQESSAPHYHNAVDEIVILQKGKLQAYEGDVEKSLCEGDMVCFKAGERKLHYLKNISSNKAEYLVVRSKIDFDDVSYS